MSRVERTDNPSPRRGSEQRREAQRGRADTNRRAESPGHTPGKAEGEDRDIEEALKSQQE